MTQRYVSYCITASGQPSSHLEWHSSKRAAVSRARKLREALLPGGGGYAVAEGWRTLEVLYHWHESAAGGFKVV